MRSWQTILYHVARLALAAVFIYAGAVKMQDVTVFAGHVAAYRVLPYALNYLVAATLPYVEFLAGLLLLLNARVRPALVVVGGMTLVFIVALISVVLRGLEIDCGCFDPGGGTQTGATTALLRDLGLMGLIVLAWRLRNVQCASRNEHETR